LFLLFTSCNKSPGIGGKAIIKGKIIVDEISFIGEIESNHPAQDHDVYIIYGNSSSIPNDNTETSFDGAFEFKNLNKGDYIIFTYSECKNCPNGLDSVVLKNVSITNRKEIIEIEDIHIAEF